MTTKSTESQADRCLNPTRGDSLSTISYVQHCVRQLAERRRPFPDDEQTLKQRVDDFRRTLWNLLGTMPVSKCPLNARKVDEWELAECVVERVYFESDIMSTVPALVYRSHRREGRRPAIVLIHGWPQSKEAFAPFKLLMAQAGYVVIATDGRSCGERKAVLSSDEDQLNALPAALTLGKTYLGMAVWDHIRTIDYLETREDVDPERIGVIGVCWGSMQTWIAAAVESRFKVAVPVCGTSTYEAIIGEYCSFSRHTALGTYLPNILLHGDFQDIGACIAPRPLLVLSNSNDVHFPVSGYNKVVTELAQVYATLEVPDGFQHLLQSTSHDITPEFGHRAREWFDRWL